MIPGARALTRTVGASSMASWRVMWMQRRLGDVVDADPRRRLEAAQRGDVEDHPALVGHGGRPGRLDVAQRPLLVGLPGLRHGGDVGRHHRPEPRVGGGVVDEDVEPAQLGHAVGHAGLHRLGVADRPGKAVASPPAARSVLTVSSSSSCLRAVTHTAAPAATSDSAIARPIPRVAPVTRATFPSTRRIVLGSIMRGSLGTAPGWLAVGTFERRRSSAAATRATTRRDSRPCPTT